MRELTYQDIVRAAARLQGHIRETPLVQSGVFDGALKLESMQETGAYKARGALNALIKQVEAGDLRPVIAASAGNHAAGVAWAARKVGLQAIAVVPDGAPIAKTERIRNLGGEVRHHGPDFDAAFYEAKRLSQEHNWRMLHPFDDLDVIEGQGSLGLELLSFQPDVVALPIGGGGLASGVGTVLKAHGIRVVGVQVRGVHAMAGALGFSREEKVRRHTIADGVRVRTVGENTKRICARVLDDILLVSEQEVRQTMRTLATTEHLVVEGAGAVAVAALRRLPGHRKIAVVSGGNIDATTLCKVLAPHANRPHAVPALRGPLPFLGPL